MWRPRLPAAKRHVERDIEVSLIGSARGTRELLVELAVGNQERELADGEELHASDSAQALARGAEPIHRLGGRVLELKEDGVGVHARPGGGLAAQVKGVEQRGASTSTCHEHRVPGYQSEPRYGEQEHDGVLALHEPMKRGVVNKNTYVRLPPPLASKISKSTRWLFTHRPAAHEVCE